MGIFLLLPRLARPAADEGCSCSARLRCAALLSTVLRVRIRVGVRARARVRVSGHQKQATACVVRCWRAKAW